MVKIGSTTNKRRYERFSYPNPKRISASMADNSAGENRRDVDVLIRDISPGGAALDVDMHIGNDQFIELHMENVGTIKAEVRHVYEDGFAVEFQVEDKKRQRIAEEIAKFQKNMKKTGGVG